MRLMELLDKEHINYRVTEHRPTFTAQNFAAEEHEPGKFVAKPVIIKADDKYLMCVLPAPFKIDFDALKRQLGAKTVALAEEKDIADIFPDCDLGAEPPFGNLYQLPTVIDKSLTRDDHIKFQGGTHERAVTMSMEDYKRLVNPTVLDFCYR